MRIATTALIFAAALAVAPATGAAAQGTPVTVPLDSGRLVRLSLDDGTVIRGRLVRPFAADSPEVAFCRYPAAPCRGPDAPALARLDARLIEGIEVARATRVWQGTAIGAGVGGVLGSLAGSLHSALCAYAERTGCEAPALWLVSGLVGGAFWGALIGSQNVVWGPAQ